ncbi:MAG: damage-control phosphatase ARMT1 family protein [Bacteroidales bacterium]
MMPEKTIDPRCRECLTNNIRRLFNRYDVPEKTQKTIEKHLDQLVDSGRIRTTPEIQREVSRLFRQLTGVEDPYREEKATSNSMARKLYQEWTSKVKTSPDPFDLALRLSIAGNIMDYGAGSRFDVHHTIEQVLQAPFAIDHSRLLQENLAGAKHILYLGDNAGEIYFDRLLIEIIGPKHITYAVRGGYALNDATLEDAREAGIDRIARVIHNGFDAPSTVLEQCSEEFMEAYRKADLIISKGQGNLEGLIYEKDPRIFFLLMVKCEVMAEMTGVEKGSFVVFNRCYR